MNSTFGKGRRHWLPAPDGPIYLVMRLYWPKTTPPSILPAGEGTWKPPAVKEGQLKPREQAHALNKLIFNLRPEELMDADRKIIAEQLARARD